MSYLKVQKLEFDLDPLPELAPGEATAQAVAETANRSAFLDALENQGLLNDESRLAYLSSAESDQLKATRERYGYSAMQAYSLVLDGLHPHNYL